MRPAATPPHGRAASGGAVNGAVAREGARVPVIAHAVPSATRTPSNSPITHPFDGAGTLGERGDDGIRLTAAMDGDG